ncbi:response regulator transcription factor [Bifidobacterium adolescentis]|uniref:response regulator transcription factor n=1 Tax=Bifidobacterium adolescentis TaxID=1680 RepID=UPI003D0716D1
MLRVHLVLRGNPKRGTEQNDDNREHADDGHGFLVRCSHDFSFDSSQEPCDDVIQFNQPNKTIAKKLGLSEATVRSYISEIFTALGYTNRGELTITAIKAGYCPPCKRPRPTQKRVNPIAGPPLRHDDGIWDNPQGAFA